MIRLVRNNGVLWYQNESVWVKGYCFDEQNNFLEKENLLDFFAEVLTEHDLEKKLKEINGVFSVVIKRDDKTMLASDKTRVYPLFYSVNQNELHISDDPSLILPPSPEIDKDAEVDFLFSSVVLDRKTLIKHVYQVNPSSFVVFQEGCVTQKTYYSYGVTEKEITAYNDPQEIFSNTLRSCFNRLIESTRGRQLVIPLSGGYDSRLIVAMLKKLHCNNVICYTVGRPDNPEYNIAKKVAETLDYPYYFIDNSSPEIIGGYFEDECFKKYYAFSGAFSNLFWMYEYFGVKELVKKNIIQKDAVFIPGHSGDFLAGSQLSKANISKQTSYSHITSLILSEKFAFRNALKNNYLREKVHDFVISRENYLSYSIFDDFDVQIKLPKNINNSVRIYEFFGHEVRLPFWDNELMEFFRTLPVEMKYKQHFYNNYLKEHLFAEFNLNFSEELDLSNFELNIQLMKNKIKKLLPDSVVAGLSHEADYTCMKEISLPLKNELPQLPNKVKGGYNRYFLEWYLFRVKKEVTKN